MEDGSRFTVYLIKPSHAVFSKESDEYYLIEQIPKELENESRVSLLINRRDGSFKVAGIPHTLAHAL